MSTQTDLHNALVPAIVEAILSPMTKHGGDYRDALVLLETAIVGVVLVLANDTDQARRNVVAAVVDAVGKRLDREKLRDMGVEGSA
jgi:hypothetical protein